MATLAVPLNVTGKAKVRLPVAMVFVSLDVEINVVVVPAMFEAVMLAVAGMVKLP